MSKNARRVWGAIGPKSLALIVLASTLAWAATTYVSGTSPSSAGLTLGTFQTDVSTHPSVPGTGGGGVYQFLASGSVLDGSGDLNRVFIYDTSAAADLADGACNRGDPNFAMLIWDFGAPVDFIRIFPMQDHVTDVNDTDLNKKRDVMEQSVWVSDDGDHWMLLSDPNGENGGVFGVSDEYTFAGVAPDAVYRGGSFEFPSGQNQYTRDYTLTTPHRWIGIRGSTLGLALTDHECDPEIDAIVAHVAETHTGTCTGYTPGYWHNRNGQKKIKNANYTWLSTLNAFHLADQNGNDKDFTVDAAGASDLASWLVSGNNAVNMAQKLSQQLAAMELNILSGSADRNCLVYTGTHADCIPGHPATVTIGTVVNLAEAALAADQYTPSGDPNRANQECLKDILDAANNNQNWVP